MSRSVRAVRVSALAEVLALLFTESPPWVRDSDPKLQRTHAKPTSDRW
jgi:hypothetical protein